MKELKLHYTERPQLDMMKYLLVTFPVIICQYFLLN